MIISKHAKERYAMRIKSFKDKADIAMYIAENDDKICEDIGTMVQYAKLLYRGRPVKKEYGDKIHEIYMRHNWIIIVDAQSKTVVTLYAVDLGLDKEFNITYCKEMANKIESIQNEMDLVKEKNKDLIKSLDSKLTEYNGLIEDYTNEIGNLKNTVKSIEQTKKDLKNDVDYLEVKIRDCISKLTGSRIF